MRLNEEVIMAKKKEPVAWITVNGVHVPIFEGESKSDAVKRAIDKAKSNAKANEDQKAKDIAKNEAEKAKMNNKTNSSNNDTSYAYTKNWSREDAEKYIAAKLKNNEGGDSVLLEKNGHYDVAKNWKEAEDAIKNHGWKHEKENVDKIRKLAGLDSNNKGSLSDASAGKASDEVSQKAKDLAKNEAEKDKLNEVNNKNSRYEKETKRFKEENSSGTVVENYKDAFGYDSPEEYVRDRFGGYSKEFQQDRINEIKAGLKKGSLPDASSGKAVDNEKVRLKGISDTINAIDRDKLNYTYDKDKNEYIISKKDYDKMYNDAVNKKYIENLQVGKGSGELQTHGYLKGSLLDASSGKAVDDVKAANRFLQEHNKIDAKLRENLEKSINDVNNNKPGALERFYEAKEAAEKNNGKPKSFAEEYELEKAKRENKGSISDSSSGKAVDGVKGSSGNKDWSKQDIQKLADSRKISYDEAKKIVERYNKPDNAGDAAVDRFRNASAGKASDEARVNKYDLKNPPKNKSSEEYEKWYNYANGHLTDWQKANGHSSLIIPDVPSTPMYFDSFRTTLRKKEPGFKGKSIPQVVSKLKTMSYDERGRLYEKYTHITHIPASFEKNYPNLSYSELKKKYEEYLKKNRK